MQDGTTLSKEKALLGIVHPCLLEGVDFGVLSSDK